MSFFLSCLLVGTALLFPLGGVESFLSMRSPLPAVARYCTATGGAGDYSAAAATTRPESPRGKSFSITFEDLKDREMRYKQEQHLRDESNKVLAKVVSDIKRHDNIQKDYQPKSSLKS